MVYETSPAAWWPLASRGRRIYIYIWVSAKLTQCKNNTKSIRAALVDFVFPAAVFPDGFVWLEADFDKCCFFPAWVWNRRFGKLEKNRVGSVVRRILRRVAL